MGKGGQLQRGEMGGLEILEAIPEVWDQFQQAIWEELCFICDGYNVFSQAFTEGFDGENVSIAEIYFPVIEHTFSEETSLPINGY